MRTRQRQRRAGFTLAEILTVVLIIAILAALLLPAIMAAVRAANRARVVAEEKNMETALADFKNRFGEYPPSRIVLYNLAKNQPAPYNLTDPTAVGSGDITRGDLATRTVRAFRKYWPRAGAYLPTSGPCPSDWSWGPNAQTVLTGDECLVFFLGGIATKPPSGGFAVTGFNRDSANPFSPPGLTTGTDTPRSTPVYEFTPNRLADLDSDGFPSYVDPLSAGADPSNLRPYMYFSAYGYNGYDPNDCNVTEADDAGQPVARMFFVNFAIASGSRVASSAAPNPYTLGDPDPANPTAGQQFHNSNSFQILSAGADGLWGPGGSFAPDSRNNRIGYGFPNDPANAQLTRVRERDNIANFSGGQLD